MTTADQFHSLHVKGAPLVLYNIWDAGSAKAVVDGGADAVATGSWSVAAAQGYADGEAIPLDTVERIAERICAAVSVPVTVDFEGGYSASAADVAQNVARLAAAGAVGINFEDRVVTGDGIYSVNQQVERLQAIRDMSDQKGLNLFINARTDLFLQSDRAEHEANVDAALQRADAYYSVGASGFFVPGLVKPDLIRTVCDNTELPVNVMMMDGAPSIDELASLGVARISYGPGPFVSAMHALTDAAAAVYKR